MIIKKGQNEMMIDFINRTKQLAKRAFFFFEVTTDHATGEKKMLFQDGYGILLGRLDLAKIERITRVKNLQIEIDSNYAYLSWEENN